MPRHKDLLQEFEGLIASSASAEALMQRVSDRLHQEMPRYNWVGFYLVDPTDPTFLIVGPYTGSFSPNVRIPLDRGLCGAAASTGQTVVVQDVSKDPRYLAGTDMVKSEIVVPIFAARKLVGELDVESYFLDTFDAAEKEFVEGCAAIVGRYFEQHKAR
jgi:GAF domain-containing protein